MKKTIISILFATSLLPSLSYAEGVVLGTSTENTKNENTPLTATTSKEESSLKKFDFTLCSQEAIETRDTSIASSRFTYNEAMNDALSERKTKEKNAVAMKNEGDKKAAVKSSVENYRTAVRLAQNNLTQSRKSAWHIFEQDIKKCRELQAEEIKEEDKESSALLANEATSTVSQRNKEDGGEMKGLRETIKGQLELIRSLFN